MLDLTLFRRPPFGGVALGALIISGTLIASPSYLGLYLVTRWTTARSRTAFGSCH
jgi:hypothetical protein